MAAESVNLSQSLSPHQTFTPINRLQEKDVSPYVSPSTQILSFSLNDLLIFTEPQRRRQAHQECAQA